MRSISLLRKSVELVTDYLPVVETRFIYVTSRTDVSSHVFDICGPETTTSIAGQITNAFFLKHLRRIKEHAWSLGSLTKMKQSSFFIKSRIRHLNFILTCPFFGTCDRKCTWRGIELLCIQENHSYFILRHGAAINAEFSHMSTDKPTDNLAPLLSCFPFSFEPIASAKMHTHFCYLSVSTTTGPDNLGLTRLIHDL